MNLRILEYPFPAFLPPSSFLIASLCCAVLPVLVLPVLVLVLVVDVVDVVGSSGIRGAMAGQGEALMAGG